MNAIKAILIDDEESARDVLENLLTRFCPHVQILAKCHDIPSAVPLINNLQPDLVFLDIEMPNHSGFEIIEFIQPVNFQIIFVTAYNQYAIKAFEIAAIDYLLKPIDISRLKNAIQRVLAHHNIQEQTQRLDLLNKTLQQKNIQNIAILDKGSQRIIPTQEIIAVEAQESYCQIHTIHSQYTTSKNLKHYQTLFETLPEFIRIHKSWIVNTQHILSINKSELIITLKNQIQAKISRNNKINIQQLISIK
ncbi:MAG: LytTR family DNA-binding domain-containing protein [Bacteroidota bacterium]|nr:LytTR family DNA-binding domain-containing protein [Bacteroidota bacterium]